MKRVQIGVIGAGSWATFAHIPAVKSHPHAELAAGQSRERAKAERIARDFGAKHACTSVGDSLAISEIDIDAVIIASTPNVHFMQAKAACEAAQTGRNETIRPVRGKAENVSPNSTKRTAIFSTPHA